MTRYTVTLTRPATEIAIVVVDADNEISALNIAFKEIDRLKDKPQDARIVDVRLELHPEQESVWEEQSVT